MKYIIETTTFSIKTISNILLGWILFSYCLTSNSQDINNKTPVIITEWKRIVYYPNNHLNDFCIFQDKQKIWHATGIMGTGTWASETSLFHCTSKNLLSTFEIKDPILTEMPKEGIKPQKHAPFVVYYNKYYHLFYRRPSGTILKIKSRNPNKWVDLGELVFEKNDARDICIIEIDGIFYMYYCQYIEHEGKKRSAILLRKSQDLENWSEEIAVYIDMEHEDKHSKLESPYLVKEDEGYYLFIRNRHLDDKTTTVVLFSKNPEKFPSGIRTWFHELNYIHAPEIVNYKNKNFIIRVSGARHADKTAPEKEGWLEIAEFEFK